jgi:DNA-binding NarL/FixJ family response regulator
MNPTDEPLPTTPVNPLQEIARLLHATAALIASLEHAEVAPLVRNVRVATRLLVMVAARAPVVGGDGDGARSLPARWDALGPRERQIAALLAEGKSYKEIATALGMGLSSVCTRVKTVYLKLGVHSKLDLQRAVADARLASANGGNGVDHDASAS